MFVPLHFKSSTPFVVNIRRLTGDVQRYICVRPVLLTVDIDQKVVHFVETPVTAGRSTHVSADARVNKGAHCPPISSPVSTRMDTVRRLEEEESWCRGEGVGTSTSIHSGRL